MAINRFLFASVFVCCLVATCDGIVSFNSLKPTLTVTATHKGGVLKAGVDNVTVTWMLDPSVPAGTDSSYKTIKVKLCYAPVSQVDRGWRKTKDDLSKDKTCSHKIVAKPYVAGGAVATATWTVQRDVPTAKYFVRAYAHDAADMEVAYGQTTSADKKTNLFDIEAVTGRHVSLDIASVCFSAFSVVSLFGFFFLERRKTKIAEAK
ncbi:hypothetical protein ABFS82_09G003900 [Erythranthe guttata]|uniref:High-affinity nitrate transporter n=1 Tax=Erythranthe guttata TaxID=4155 RepID=A0A022Q3R5_ERYGU|nr:PREDICTED: high-affinity nitrate transporter 3.1-like [Erythranthe guttata]EYU22284.1 hypothetical protein MIMGU_mgv1a025936mg [Erythranthe guttata]|eukprot:XP_012855584.1 PREDICTED: high-affinity nitrate transporter 3.1-like [Erythranthe guttata]